MVTCRPKSPVVLLLNKVHDVHLSHAPRLLDLLLVISAGIVQELPQRQPSTESHKGEPKSGMRGVIIIMILWLRITVSLSPSGPSSPISPVQSVATASSSNPRIEGMYGVYKEHHR